MGDTSNENGQLKGKASRIPACDLGAQLATLSDTSAYCDVKLICQPGGSEFMAHKAILAGKASIQSGVEFSKHSVFRTR